MAGRRQSSPSDTGDDEPEEAPVDEQSIGLGMLGDGDRVSVRFQEGFSMCSSSIAKKYSWRGAALLGAGGG